MAIGSLLKKTATVYAAKKGFDAVRGARRPEPRRSLGRKLVTAIPIALIGGAGIILARRGRLPAVPNIIGRKTSPGFDSAADGDGPFTESSRLSDRPI